VAKNGTEVTVQALPPCDIHSHLLHDSNPPEAHYDGATTHGPWANMCEDCFRKYGVGLGTGRGQKLVLATPAPAQGVPGDSGGADVA
jgi:hypothetical protein